jgi:hypothetical protein
MDSSRLHSVRLAVLLALIGIAARAALAVDIGATQTVPSRQAPRAVSQAAVTSATDEELARIWSLSLAEIQRARMLMQGPRATFSSPQLSPIEALGIHARSDGEREHYARLFARVSYEDTLRVLAWTRSAQAEVQRITAGQSVVNFADAPKAAVSTEAADMLGVPRSAVVPPNKPAREFKAKPPEARAVGRAAENRPASKASAPR